MVTNEIPSGRDRQDDGIEEHLAASVDEALGDLLGSSVVEAFDAYLLDMGVSQSDLTRRVELLCSALDDTFEERSISIQEEIARRLFNKLGMKFVPIEGAGLVEYIREAREIEI